MKNRQYAPIFKNIGLVMQITLTVIFVMSVFLLSALIQKNMLDTTDVSNTQFMDSDCYSELFQKKTDDLISFLKLRNKFEIAGEYESQKIINVLQYSQGNTLTERTENQTQNFTMSEAENVYVYTEGVVEAKEDVSQDSEADTEGTALDEETMSPEEIEKEYKRQQEQKEKDRVLIMMSHYVLSDLISWSKAGYSKTPNGVLDEEYLPIGGISIAQAKTANEITQEQAVNLYRALETTLSVIGAEETAYKKGMNEFQKEETNLTYAYGENGDMVYSNFKIEEDLLAYARAQGSYLYYNGEDLKFRTNVNGMEQYYFEHLDEVLSGIGSGTRLMIAVDTGLSYDDDFQSAKKEFDILHPWMMRSIVAVVVSLFGWVIALMYLTTVTGRTTDDEEIHLNLLDRIKTELFFGMFVLLTVLFITISFGVARGDWDIPGMLIMTGVSAFVIDIVFLIFYLSMIRRVKAGKLWEYSLMYWILRSTKRVARTWKSSIRVILLFIISVTAFLFLGYEAFSQKSILAIAILLILIVAVGINYLRTVVQQQEIMDGIEKITNGDLAYKLPLDNLHGDKRELAEAVNRIGDGLRNAVDESTKNERMKADLITNVSHDIKTPLTSIINYVNLLKAEKIQDKRTRDYIHILDEKSQRLRQLTEDLVEASRISSGNITLQMTEINLVELIYQTGGEFNEKFEAKGLTTITKLPKETAIILADGRRIWRVVENLYNNVAKYAMSNTRVYVTVEMTREEVSFSIKNISEQLLNVDSVDLTERFIRGDEARTTEGSGLGLSIARNLTTMMDGKFDIELDGDLFTATITFPLVNKTSEQDLIF